MHSLSKLRLAIDNDSAAARYEQPVHREVFRLGCAHVKAYHADLAIDAVVLHKALADTAYLFIAREHGTHLYILKDGPGEAETNEVASTIAEHGESNPLAAAIVRIVSNANNDMFPMATFHRVTWEVVA